MKVTCIVPLIAFTIMTSTVVKADENACVAIYENSTKNFETSHRKRVENTYLFNLYCESSGEAKAFTSSASVSFPIKGIPIQASGDGKWSESELKDFCKIGVDKKYYESSETNYGSYVVGGALDSFNRCLEFSGKEIVVTHSENAPEGVTINFNFKDTGKEIDVHGVNANDDKIKCIATGVPNAGDRTVVGFGKGFVGQKKDFAIQCKRIALDENGKTYYPPMNIVVSTSEGNYPITLGADTLNGYYFANESKRALDAAIIAKNKAESTLRNEVDTKNVLIKLVATFEVMSVYFGDQYTASYMGDTRSDCTNQKQPIIDYACTSKGKIRISQKQVASQAGGRCGHTWYAVMCRDK